MQYRYTQSTYYGGGNYYGPSFGYHAGITSGVRSLLIANIAVFIIQQLARILEPYLGFYWFDMLFGLVPSSVVRYGFVWQPFTYMFLHGGVLHLLSTCWSYGCLAVTSSGTGVRAGS